MKDFIQKHHVLSLATIQNGRPSSCSLFYAFIPEECCLVFASEDKSEHMQNIMQTPEVSAVIHDEQRELMLIKGIQIKGKVSEAEPKHEHFYLEAFPEAKDFVKEMWTIEVRELKYTDNQDIGLGKKEVWKY
jgi:uncharacterized protein YhbP (UPF0306 family)